MHYLDESHILLFLVQVFILMASARGLGELLRRWKQPALTGEILVGVILGPTLLGRFLPEIQQILFPPDAIQQAMLDTLAWFGVLFLLLESGLEIDFSIAWRKRGSALVIAFSDIIIPIVVAFFAVLWLPAGYMVDPGQRIPFSLFMAAVMTISAIPVSARIMHDLKLLKSELGFLVMSALAVNDIIGWVLFTVILGIFTSNSVEITGVALILGVTIGFSVLSLTLGRRLSTAIFDAVKRKNMPEPGTSLTITALFGLLFGIFTQKLGIHALFGFLIAGIVVGEAKSLSEKTRGVISQLVHSLFVPLFFAGIGLKIDFVASFDPFLVTLMCVVGIGGRYLGAWLGVTWTREPRINRDLIAIAHTPGGMMEIVVALIALETGLITPEVFVAIVFSAVFSSLLMGPWMRRSMNRRKHISPAEFITEQAVVTDLKGRTSNEVICELIDRVGAREKSVDCGIIREVALDREGEYGTAVGSGVAIPHVRLEGLDYPMLAYGRSSDGIEWNAPDGDPVRHVFLLITPTGTEDIHVQSIASIASAVSKEENRRMLESGDPSALPEELKRILAGKSGKD